MGRELISGLNPRMWDVPCTGMDSDQGDEQGALARRTMHRDCNLEAMVTTDGAVRPLPHVCQVHSVAICIVIQKRANQNALPYRRPHRSYKARRWSVQVWRTKYMRRSVR
jgi:hypothetical protein